MDIRQALDQVQGELASVLGGVDRGAAARLVDALAGARRIFVTGEGRSGLIARTFAMRLVHLGLTAYVCGETITPAIEPGDVFVACSGSGQTPITCHRATESRRVGATLVAVVAAQDTPLGKEAEVEAVLPAPTKLSTAPLSHQFGATLFEQALLLFLDSIVLLLQERRGASPESMFAKHANLE